MESQNIDAHTAYLAGILLAEVDIVVLCEVSVLAGEVHLLPAQVAHKVLDGPAAAGLLLRGIRNLYTCKKIESFIDKFI